MFGAITEDCSRMQTYTDQYISIQIVYIHIYFQGQVFNCSATHNWSQIIKKAQHSMCQNSSVATAGYRDHCVHVVLLTRARTLYMLLTLLAYPSVRYSKLPFFLISLNHGRFFITTQSYVFSLNLYLVHDCTLKGKWPNQLVVLQLGVCWSLTCPPILWIHFCQRMSVSFR